MLDEFDFWDGRYEGRRLFSELLGTFFLVLVAVGGGMVNARFGGSAVPYGALVVAPALMVGGHHPVHGGGLRRAPEPGGQHRLRAAGRLPVAARARPTSWPSCSAPILATLLLWALIGKQGSGRAHPARPRDLDPDGDAVGDRPDHRVWSA